MTADKFSKYMYDLIDRVVSTIGPREPCSEAELKAADMMAEEFKPMCDAVKVEPFTCSPTAFLGFLPISVILYIIAAGLYWVFAPAALFFALVGFVMLFFEFMRYKEFVDFLFPKKTSKNVLGVIKPRGEVKRRLIVCGHMDSAYEFNLFLLLKNGAVVLMIIGVLATLILLGASIAKTIAYFNGTADARIYVIFGAISIGLYPILGLFLQFHSYHPVPGAMDDMAGVAVAAGLGKYLSDAKQNGGFVPQHTEVVLYAAGCEEAGLRGAKRYVAAHKQELLQTPTTALIYDGVYDEKFLTVITREICTGAKHDKKLVNAVIDIAKKRNMPIRKRLVPFGASDSSVFSLAGISSTCILCQDVDTLVPNYHTRFDTVEKIRPEALAVSLQVAVDMLEKIDAEAGG